MVLCLKEIVTLLVCSEEFDTLQWAVGLSEVNCHFTLYVGSVLKTIVTLHQEFVEDSCHFTVIVYIRSQLSLYSLHQ